MPSHLGTLRRIYLAADAVPALFPPVDDDLSREAGTNGYLARLLQAARDLDAAETPAPAPTAHTPEPWVLSDDHEPLRVAGHGVYPPAYDPVRAAPVLLVGADAGGGAVRVSDANLRRIVACVNACAGIDDPGAALAEVRALLRAIIRNPGNRYGVENYAEQAFALLSAE